MLSLPCEVAPLTVSPAPLVVSLTVLVKPVVVSPTVLPTPPTTDKVSGLIPTFSRTDHQNIPAPPTVSVTPPTVLPRVSVTPPRNPCQPNQLVRTKSRAARTDILPPALPAIAAELVVGLGDGMNTGSIVSLLGHAPWFSKEGIHLFSTFASRSRLVDERNGCAQMKYITRTRGP